MPQFDFSTYSSQIFWFGLCFAVLYFFVSKIILPRIRDIQKERKSVIDSDISEAESTQETIKSLQNKSAALRKDASQAYKSQLDEAMKEANVKREKLTEELKEKIEKITDKSKEELNDFLKSSESQSKPAIENLTKMIKAKLFNIS